MGDLSKRIALIDELSRHTALEEAEVGLLNVARCNVDRCRQQLLLEEQAEVRRIFDEIGFRLDRLKCRIKGRNIRVFNPPKMWVRGPQAMKVRAGG